MRAAHCLITLIACLCAIPVFATSDILQQELIRGSMSSAPVAFTKNEGQWPDSVFFRAEASGAVMWFVADGIYYQFTRRVQRNGAHPTARPAGIFDPRGSLDDIRGRPRSAGPGRSRDSVETILIKAEFVGSNTDSRITGEGMLEYRCNYFLGNDPAKWRIDVPNFRGITLREVYPGVDIHFEGNGKGSLVYGYSLAPDANVGQIRVTYRGPGVVSTDDQGRAVLYISFGEMSGLLSAPTNNAGTMSESTYSDCQEGDVGLPVGAVRRSQAVELVYSTFLGGSTDAVQHVISEDGEDIAVDDAGCAYVIGYTYASDFPTQDAYDTNLGGTSDVFITKFSAAGNSLVYSTFLGGSNDDVGVGIAVDDAHCAYVTGQTMSSDFPTHGAFDAVYAGGNYDAFVTKFSAGGNSLVYSTFLGGSSDEWGGQIDVDDSGCTYVTGVTWSSDFPTHSAYDTSLGGDLDVFVTKLSSAGNTLDYSTFLGGSNWDLTGDIVVDNFGCAYVTGYTMSSDFPTQNAYDASYGGDLDGFVAKFSATGNNLVYGTFLGGSSLERVWGIAVDGAGCAYVTGYTMSSDFPTQSAYDASLGGGGDAFVTEFSAAGNNLVYSTFLGGAGDDLGDGIAVDNAGSIYVTGYTYSLDFPTQSAYDVTLGGGCDAFVTKFTAGGSSLIYSTFLGGSDWDVSGGIVVDEASCAYVIGCTMSSDFPTQYAYDASFGGSYDAFVTKLSASSGCCLDIRGNVDNSSDDQMSISDLTFLVTSLFQGGPDPACFEEGDVDASGAINIADLTYFVSFLFQGGPQPLPCP